MDCKIVFKVNHWICKCLLIPLSLSLLAGPLVSVHAYVFLWKELFLTLPNSSCFQQRPQQHSSSWRWGCTMSGSRLQPHKMGRRLQVQVKSLVVAAHGAGEVYWQWLTPCRGLKPDTLSGEKGQLRVRYRNSLDLGNKYASFHQAQPARWLMQHLLPTGEGALCDPEAGGSCRSILSISQGETYFSYHLSLCSAGEVWHMLLGAQGCSCNNPPDLHRNFAQGKHWIQHRNIHQHLGRRTQLTQILIAATRLICSG